MSEIRRVSYSLTGEGVPVIHHECRTVEETRQAFMLAMAMTIEQAQEKMIAELASWLEVSANYQKTVDLWAAAYVRCGTCRNAWARWLADNPIGDDWRSWIELARARIVENQWV